MKKTKKMPVVSSEVTAFFSEESSFVLDSFDCCPIGVMILYRNSKTFERMNKKCYEIFDLIEFEMRDMDFRQVLSSIQGLNLDGSPVKIVEYPIFKNFDDQKPMRLVFSIAQHGNRRIISMNSAPIVINGIVTGVISTVEDITDLVVSQTKLECAMARLENLWNVSKNRFLSIKEVCDITLESIGEITKSKYGFFGFLDDSEENMIIHSWSGETMKGCTVIDKPFVYPIKDSGLWAEAIRQRRHLIINDYSSCDLPKKGYPVGHVELKNLMVIPHFVGDKIHSVAAVANKELDYSTDDVVSITEFLDDIQSVIMQIEAENLLKKSEEKYRNLVELMNEGVLVLDFENIVTFVNTKMTKIIGYDPNEIIGHNFVTFIHCDSRENFIQQQLLRGKGVSESYEMILVNKNGEKVFVLSSPTILLSDDGHFKGSYEVITNISNIKLIEMQLIHSQKMETIGVMAAGIAHEINTPLQYIVGNTHFIKENAESIINQIKSIKYVCTSSTLPGPADKLLFIEKIINNFDINFAADEIPAAIDETIEGLDRISSIVLSIKKFSHPEFDEPQSININSEIRNTINVSRNEWKYYAKLMTKFDENLPNLVCVASDFNQIILNLIVNAAHAMQGKFKLADCKGVISILTSHEKNYIQITIADNGSGIPDKIKDKIFNPFFTTKEVGKGTGMGLAIVLKLIEKHKGKIWFETKENEGTIFYVQFPTATREQDSMAR